MKTIPEIISFNTLRKSVGILGILLPVVLVLGSLILENCDGYIQTSISHYYYTNLHVILIGILCVVAFFLFCYKGFDKWDNIACNTAGFFCLGIALFPTIPKVCPCQNTVVSLIDLGNYNNLVHFTCAGGFLLSLAIISLFLFTKSSKPKSQRSDSKNKRNVIYIICGCVMIACLIGLLFGILIKDNNSCSNHLVIWLEAISLWAFGISWLIKGEIVLKDKKDKHSLKINK